MPPAAPSTALRTDEEMTPVTPAFTSRRSAAPAPLHVAPAARPGPAADRPAAPARQVATTAAGTAAPLAHPPEQAPEQAEKHAAPASPPGARPNIAPPDSAPSAPDSAALPHSTAPAHSTAPVRVLTLPERLDTRAAPALAQALAQTLTRALADPLPAGEDAAALVLDASAVRFVGALCAQVLLAAADAADSDGNDGNGNGNGARALVVAGPSDAFTAGLARLGVDALLADRLHAPAGRAAP